MGSHRITFVLPGTGVSGIIRVTVEMANRLLDRGHDVRLACQVVDRPFLSASKVRGHYLRLRAFAARDWVRDFRGRRDSYVRLDDLRFGAGEVVIAICATTSHYVKELDQVVLKVRYFHGFHDERSRSELTALGAPLPTVSVSKELVARLAGMGVDVVGVVPNGVDTGQYYPDGSERDGIGMVFSRHPLKDPETAVELMRRVEKRWPTLPRYVFASCRRPAELPRKHFHRLPSISKARELYSRSKIWLVTSRSEGFCLPILEAMACGCAVISSRHDNARGMITHRENGFIVPVGDVPSFLECIELLLKDEGLRQTVVQNGFETVKKFGWDNAVESMETCLQRLQARSSFV